MLEVYCSPNVFSCLTKLIRMFTVWEMWPLEHAHMANNTSIFSTSFLLNCWSAPSWLQYPLISKHVQFSCILHSADFLLQITVLANSRQRITRPEVKEVMMKPWYFIVNAVHWSIVIIWLIGYTWTPVTRTTYAVYRLTVTALVHNAYLTLRLLL